MYNGSCLRISVRVTLIGWGTRYRRRRFSSIGKYILKFCTKAYDKGNENDMKKAGKSRKKKIILILASVILCAALVLGGLMIYGNAQMGKIPGLTFMDALNYTTQGKPDARITVGIIQDGQDSFTVYGENGQILPEENHVYEIGSLTKTITASMISRAVMDGRIRLDDTIDAHLPLPEGKSYPTITELLTHTSGYSAYFLRPR